MDLTPGDIHVLRFLKPSGGYASFHGVADYVAGLAQLTGGHPLHELAGAGLVAIVGDGRYVCLTEAGRDRLGVALARQWDASSGLTRDGLMGRRRTDAN
jgi:hypothetical protein